MVLPITFGVGLPSTTLNTYLDIHRYIYMHAVIEWPIG